MEKKIFIQSNNKQILGAYLGKYAFERFFSEGNEIPVEIINVDEEDVFKHFNGHTYTFTENEERTYNKDDLQSFTLSRFMPPKLMNYKGRALVIDPDIFTLVDIHELFELDLEGNTLAACRKKDAWDSSVMLLDNTKLTHWDIDQWIKDLKENKVDYITIMTLANEQSVQEIPRIWNSTDYLDKNTKMLHTTKRLTQPWRTGLPIDFTRNKMPKLFGVIPREPIYKLLGKYPTHYQEHPNKKIETFFINLVKDALKDSAITHDILEYEIAQKHVRPDLLELVSTSK